MPSSRLPDFHKLSPSERLDRLVESGWLKSEDAGVFGGETQSRNTDFSRFVENWLGVLPIPLGVVTNVQVDGQDRLIPMATEEPSIIAACSRAALLCRENGGVQTRPGLRRAGCQILLQSNLSQRVIEEKVAARWSDFVDKAHRRHPRLVASGGRVLEFRVQPSGVEQAPFFVLVVCDPADAMGANFVDDVGELFQDRYQGELGGRFVTSIVTNHPLTSGALATATVPVGALTWGARSGMSVAQDIVTLSNWAKSDPLRRSTHDKGVLNGIGSMFLALYQDTRALHAALASQVAASRRPLVTWTLNGEQLRGTFEAQIPCGIAGGTAPHVPTTKLFLSWMKVTSGPELERVAAAIGVLQNLGALRTLVTHGIQRGHMPLHGRKIREE